MWTDQKNADNSYAELWLLLPKPNGLTCSRIADKTLEKSNNVQSEFLNKENRASHGFVFRFFFNQMR